MADWRKSPLSVEQCDLTDPDFIIAMDETGTPTLSGLDESTPPHKRWFTLTGVSFDKTTINELAKSITDLKSHYWEAGQFQNKRVVFHSRDIRRRQGAFRLPKEKYEDFRTDLNDLLNDLPILVSAASINKYKHVQRYLYPDPVYPLALSFIFERLTYRMSFLGSSCVVFLESRGKREDQNLLNIIVDLLHNGSRYLSPEKFECIKGVYFNPKRTKTFKKSYWPLEIADLVSYRIHHKQVSGELSNDFKAIESKLVDYPHYDGHGLKIFPKQSTEHEGTE